MIPFNLILSSSSSISLGDIFDFGIKEGKAMSLIYTDLETELLLFIFF